VASVLVYRFRYYTRCECNANWKRNFKESMIVRIMAIVMIVSRCSRQKPRPFLI
jgi:hypothetical protein